MQNGKLVIRFLKYLLHSNTRFGVHSPFLYQLITEVFRDKTDYDEYHAIESLKSELLKDDRIIEVTDYGAGSRVDHDNRRKVSNITLHTAKPVKYGRLLHRLVRHLQPAHVIELGTSMGLSAAYMASANPEARVYTIEGCPNIARIAKQNFDRLQLQNIDLEVGTFEDKLPEVLNMTGQAEFVFIDGNHRYQPTISYFEQCLNRAVNDTCLIFDDIHWSDEMESAWEEIKHNRKVTLSVDLFFMGLVFVRKELTKQDFLIRF